MSYILDALRKADAERERGAVPGIHAQPIFPSEARPETGGRPPSWLMPAAAAGLAVAVGGAGLGWYLSRDSGVSRGPAAPATVVAVTPPDPAPALAPRQSLVQPQPVPSLPAEPNAPVTSAPTDVAVPTPAGTAPGRPADPTIDRTPAQSATQPRPATRAAPAAQRLQRDAAAPANRTLAAPSTPPGATPAPTATPATAGSMTTATPGATAAATATATAASAPTGSSPSLPTAAANTGPAGPDARVYALNELPDDIRRQLPPLVVGGSMYSPTPANRILVLNGQVLHEGEQVAPGLTLQQIKLKAAVLAYKGYRYSIGF